MVSEVASAIKKMGNQKRSRIEKDGIPRELHCSDTKKNFDMSRKGILFIDQYKIHRDLT